LPNFYSESGTREGSTHYHKWNCICALLLNFGSSKQIIEDFIDTEIAVNLHYHAAATIVSE
jgi:hypothetical protein